MFLASSVRRADHHFELTDVLPVSMETSNQKISLWLMGTSNLQISDSQDSSETIQTLRRSILLGVP